MENYYKGGILCDSFSFILLIIIVLLVMILTTSKLKIIIKDIKIENIDDAIKILNILIYEKDDKLKLEFLNYLKFKLKIKILAFENTYTIYKIR